jgi:hypothetical protein
LRWRVASSRHVASNDDKKRNFKSIEEKEEEEESAGKMYLYVANPKSLATLTTTPTPWR